MNTYSIIKYVLADSISLNEYICGKIPSYNDIKRRLLLLMRGENKDVPDHYYRLNQCYSLNEIDSLPAILTQGLYKLAEEHLVILNERIYVKQEMQNSWQELITYIPPLILQMAFLNIKKPLCTNSSISEIRNYCTKSIMPNVRYTALAYPYIPELEHLLKERKGLHDLHIHLNGSTETDIVWQDLMMFPDKVSAFYKGSINSNSLAQEQIEQDFAPMNSMQLEHWLLVARRIRQYLFSVLFAQTKRPLSNRNYVEGRNIFDAGSISEVISCLVNGCDDLYDGYENPFANITLENDIHYNTPLNVEGLMYVLVLGYLVSTPNDCVAMAFHLYLLILGVFNRLLVQQKHDCGFEEFQKYTLNGIRENCESVDYMTRFLQLSGNQALNIAFIEGRFSPKLSEEENRQVICNIINGWESCWKEMQGLQRCESAHIPKLRLIAHFIKKKDDNKGNVRHEKLRKDVWERALVLSLMKTKNLSVAKYIVGIDAASSEFDAPPEVFAPTFRYLKRKGFRHFTYHAGEDFYHLIGGLRRIYEAVDFLELSYGDRIGHATAAGLSPQQWIENIGENIYMFKGEYLDDLVFAYNLIVKYPDDRFNNTINSLILKIHELYYSIYGVSCSIELITEVWKLRRLCPLHLFSETRDNARYLSVFDTDEWFEMANKFHLRTNNEEFNNVIGHENDKIMMLKQYHSPKHIKKYNEIIKVCVTEFFTDLDMEKLQLMLLRYLNEKEIIIETLPTSNVRIGHHHTFDTYHLWNWIKWEKDGHSIPPIVVGSDDTGIFATNIYNEYANIYCKLVHIHGMSRSQAMDVIYKLDRNAQIYKFT